MSDEVKRLLLVLTCIRHLILRCCRPLLGREAMDKDTGGDDAWCDRMEDGDLAPFEYGMDLEVSSDCAPAKSLSSAGSDGFRRLTFSSDGSIAGVDNCDSQDLIDLSITDAQDPHLGLPRKKRLLDPSSASQRRSAAMISKISEPGYRADELNQASKSTTSSMRKHNSLDSSERGNRDLSVRFPEELPPPTGLQMLQRRLAGFINASAAAPSSSRSLQMVEVMEYDLSSSSEDPFTPLWKRRQRDGFFDESDSEEDMTSDIGSPSSVNGPSGSGVGSPSSVSEFDGMGAPGSALAATKSDRGSLLAGLAQSGGQPQTSGIIVGAAI
eukprot:GEMP01048996.1.p2 GENE.GEMP01048996.1~~GEMP01048996.1.p2  ORF type:complete len:326 (+),score=47.36 GEMP01048996.1:113-1090(+)